MVWHVGSHESVYVKPSHKSRCCMNEWARFNFLFLLLFIFAYYVVAFCSYKNSILVLPYAHSTI